MGTARWAAGSYVGCAAPVRMHLLMCAPMLAVVGFLVATAAGGGAIGYALLCMAMMGAMMLFMNQAWPRYKH